MNIVEAKKLLDDAVKNERVVIFRLRNSSGKNLDVSFNGKITQVQVSENNVTIYTTNEDDLVIISMEQMVKVIVKLTLTRTIFV